MGGIGSGSEARHRTVESAFRLDLGDVLRGMPENGRGVAVVSRQGARLCRAIERMEIDIDLCGGSGSMRLRYEVTVRGDVVAMGERIMLVSQRQPFGGRRWWATCPISGRRVASLYLPPGALRFASREAFGLRYASQRLSPRDRTLEMAQRIRRDLGGELDMFSAFPLRPAGMHQSRYDRLRARGEGLEAANMAAIRAWIEFAKGKTAQAGVALRRLPSAD